MNILVLLKCFILYWSGIAAYLPTYQIFCDDYKMTSHIGELSYRPIQNTSSRICRYDFRPDRNVLGSGGIMYFFTELKLSHSCERSYLKFMDGYGVVTGLAEKLCINNDTLLDENVFFTTSDSTLKIEYSDPYANMSFTIKFSAYSMKDYGCEGHRCPNKLCVLSGYDCSSDIRICGAASNSCSGKTNFGEQISSKIFVDVLRYIGIAIVVVAGVLILRKLFQHRTEYVSKCHDSCEYGCWRSCCYQISVCCFPKCCKSGQEQRQFGVTMTRQRQLPETAEPSTTSPDPEIAEHSTTMINGYSSVTRPPVSVLNGNTPRRGVTDVSNVDDPPPSYSQVELYTMDNRANTDVDTPASETPVYDHGHHVKLDNANHVTLNNADSSDIIRLAFINIDTDSAIGAHGSEEHESEPEVIPDFSVGEVLPSVPPPSYDEAIDPHLYSDVIAHRSEYMA